MKHVVAFAVAAVLVSGPVAAAEIVVSQSNKQFSTEAVTAAVGDVLVFSNQDNVAHNVHSTSTGHTFNLGLQKPGESARLELSSDGTIAIRCAVHPKMKLTVTVK
ncbi:MAG: plastocyanin/azurin family copper-binding protein [Bacteroidota bacterium]